MKLFLDTYAMIEIVRGNEKYARYLDEESHTNIFNLYELYYILLRDFEKETAKKYFESFKKFCIEVKDGWIFLASEFKLKNKNVSFADALGYITAKENMFSFLTGDSTFKELENVEFVKS